MALKLLAILSLMCCSLSSARGQNSRIEELTTLLKENILSQNYEEGLRIVRTLENEDSLSYETLYDCILCLEYSKHYEECIQFCEKWVENHPNDDYVLFLGVKGECYFYLHDRENAAIWLKNYIDEKDALGSNISSYYYAIYATALKDIHRYKDAEPVYERFFNESAKEDGLTRSTLYQSKEKEYYGNKFYDYAYNFFFQGKEKEGLEQLYLAKMCGNKAATSDYAQLIKSATFCQNTEYKNSTIKDFEDCLTTLDIYKNLPTSNPVGFWQTIWENNVNFQDLQVTLKSSKRPGTLNKALSEIGKSNQYVKGFLARLQPFAVSEIEPTLDRYICGDNSFFKELRIYPANEANAFATPSGEIYLTSGLVVRYNSNYELLIGVCAHEATHYICQHSLIAAWKQAKKEKKNKIWAGVAVGLNSAAALYGASNGLSNDDSYWYNVTQINNSLIESFRLDSYYFKFKYGRFQELESDIIAYRFCESIGIGGYAYIMALQLLNDGDCYLKADKESDHPTTAFRVGLLKHLYAKEHGDN